MIRCTMLVTSDGEWVPEDSDDLLAAIGDPEPDYHAALFAVKNLGFIKYQVLEGSIVEIELHPSGQAALKPLADALQAAESAADPASTTDLSLQQRET